MVTRAFVTGIGGQDGSYLAERPGRRRARGARPRPRRRRLARALPARGACSTRATSPTSTASAPSCSTSTRTRSTTWPRSARSPSRGPSPTSPPASTASAPSGCWSRRSPCRSGTATRCAFVQASSAEMFGEPDRQPAGRVDADPARQPVRRRQGLRPPRRRRLPPPRPARGQRDPLQPRVAAAARPLRHPPDHLDRGRHRPRPGRPARPRQPGRPGATGAGLPTTSTPWSAPPAPTGPTTTSSPPASATRVRDFAAAAFARAGIADWEPLLESDPALFRPADATDLTGDAAKARRDLGWSPTVDFDEVVGRMVDADLALLD